LSDIEGKLEAIEVRFQKGSKQYDAARYIVRQNRKIPKDEQEKICQEIPIAKKSLQGLFTELKKMGLYPPQKVSDKPHRRLALEEPEESSHHALEAPQPPLQEYASKEDFETLRNSINFLASVISGGDPSNPGESEEEEAIDLIQPEGMFIQDASMNRASVYLKPKTQMYFDMARQGVFANYAGTREPGPFAQFDGNLSDFFNIIVDDYFIRNYYADIGLTMRRYVK